jgi:hypothetical protein
VLFAWSVERTQRLRLSSLVLRATTRYAWERRRERARRERRWRRRERRRQMRSLARLVLQRVGLRGRPEHRGGESFSPGGSREPTPAEVLAALERAGVLADLASSGAVVLEVGGGTDGLEAELRSRLPDLTYVLVPPEQLASRTRGRIDLAISVGSLDRLADDDLATCAERLYRLEVPVLYSLDRESERLRGALSRWYWLRQLWVPDRWAGERGTERKPDPARGPVPRRAGAYRHVVGRRRVLAGSDAPDRK